jgi:hypothetical protein
MKKMISVPVGAEPKLSKYRHGNTEYIDYGWVKETLYPSGKLTELISHLQQMQKKHRDRYQNMRFEEKNDCGCPCECSCSPSYVLYGERYETDLEYQFRLKQEDTQKSAKEERERKEYERLKAQFGEK